MPRRLRVRAAAHALISDTPSALSAIKAGDFVVMDVSHGTTAAPALVMVTAQASR